MFPVHSTKAEESMTRSKAEHMLMTELMYSKERAHIIIKQFDKNGDGKLNGKELEKFKNSVKHAKKELRDAFTAVDTQNAGFISTAVAESFLQKPPFCFPVEKVKALVKRFDKDGDGRLYYNEFISFYPEAKAAYEEIARHFGQLDADENGLLSPDELIGAIMMSTGYDESSARQFIAHFDADGNGSIDKAEFTAMWTMMFG